MSLKQLAWCYGSLIALTTGASVGAFALREAPSVATRITFIPGGDGWYWQRAGEGAKAAARDRNAELEVVDVGSDAEVQVAALRRFSQTNHEGLAICPMHNAKVDQALQGAGTIAKVVTVLHDAPMAARMTHVGLAEYKAGRKAAEAIAEVLPDGGPVVVLLPLEPSPTVTDRLAGVKDELRVQSLRRSLDAAWPIVKLTDGAPMSASAGRLNETLSRHSGPACVVRLSDGPVADLIASLSAKQKLSDVKLIAFDQSAATFAAVQAGRVHAAIAHDPYQLGYLAVAHSIQLCRGDALSLPAPGRGDVHVFPEAVGRHNVAEFVHRVGAPVRSDAPLRRHVLYHGSAEFTAF